MASTFWRDPSGATWRHLADIRDATRRNGSPNWRVWDPATGSDLGSRDALIVVGLDRNEIAGDLSPIFVVQTTNVADQIVVFGHKSSKTFGTGLVEVVVVASSHPLCQPGAERPRSLLELARTGNRLRMIDLGMILQNW